MIACMHAYTYYSLILIAHMSQDVLARVNIQPGNRVVDVGSGSGGAMKYISQVSK